MAELIESLTETVKQQAEIIKRQAERLAELEVLVSELLKSA